MIARGGTALVVAVAVGVASGAVAWMAISMEVGAGISGALGGLFVYAVAVIWRRSTEKSA